MGDKAQEKLNDLKGKRNDWEPNDKIKFAAWEKKISELMAQDGYRKLQITKQILVQAKDFARGINRELASDPTKSRDLLIARKEGYLWVVKLLSANYQEDLDAIEREIDYELEYLNNEQQN